MVDPDTPEWMITRRWIEQQFEFKPQHYHASARATDPHILTEQPTGRPLLLSYFDEFFPAKTAIWRLQSEIEKIVGIYEHTRNNMSADVVMNETGIFEVSEDPGKSSFVENLVISIHDLFENEDPQSFVQGVYESELANRIVPFFSLVQASAEEYAVEILNSELIDEEYQGSDSTMKLLRGIGQRSREKLLQRTAIVSDSLRTDMRDVRKQRNRLVHSLRNGDFFLEAEQSLDMVEVAVKMLDSLDEHSSSDEA